MGPSGFLMAHLVRDTTLRRVVEFLELIGTCRAYAAPTRLAGSWDNVGLVARTSRR